MNALNLNGISREEIEHTGKKRRDNGELQPGYLTILNKYLMVRNASIHMYEEAKGERIMTVESNEYFDLPALLKQDGPNIRKFAAAGMSVTVEEYFSMLSEFLVLAPNAEKALAKFAGLSAEKEDYISLDKMITILESMGCDRFTFIFHSLLNAYGKLGNWKEAATHAKQITEDFNQFYLRIKAARRNKRPNALQDTTLTLNEFIRHLDDEEANRRLLILAVDDSPVILQSVSSVLSSEYKVFTLPNPTKLEKVLQKLTPDLFLLDCKMPEISGFDLVPIIRNFDEHKETPIIFLTSEGTMDNVTAAIALGACDFAVKPFKPDTLREKIAKHIVRKISF